MLNLCVQLRLHNSCSELELLVASLQVCIVVERVRATE